MEKIRCAQDFVRVEAIEDGTIITSDGRFVRLLKIKSSDFLLKSADEQRRILNQYAALLKNTSARISIKSVTRPTPIAKYRRSFEKALESEVSDRCLEYIEDHIKATEKLSSDYSLDRDMYFIFEYDPENDYLRAQSKEEKIASLKSAERNLITEFSQLGNHVEEFSDPNFNVAEVLFSHYNRGNLDKESLAARIKRIEKDHSAVREHFGPALFKDADIKDILSPRSVNTKESREYIVLNGIYCSFFYVSKTGYTDEISTQGWLSQLLTLDFGIDVDIHFERQDAAEALRMIRGRARQTRIKEQSRENYASDIEEIRDNLEALDFMRAALVKGSEEYYKMSVIVSVYASSKEQLLRKKNTLRHFSARKGIELLEFTDLEEDAFLSVAPLNKPEKRVFDITGKDIYSSVIVAIYPFTAFTLLDEGGVLLGKNMNNDSLVIFNPFDSSQYNNANMLIFGTTGSGKSFALFSITTRFRYLGKQVFFIAADKQHEPQNICRMIDGEFVDVSPSARTRINPFDIWPVDLSTERLLYGENQTESSWLIDKVASLGTWVELMVPGISYDEKARVGGCLMRMYANKGITSDNGTVYQDPEAKILKPMPVFTDFVEELKTESGISAKTIAVFEQFTKPDGIYKNLNGPTNVNLRNRFIVFGCEHLRGLQGPMMFIIMDYIWSVVKSDRTSNKAIVIDEGSLLVDGRNPHVGDFVKECFRMIRGLGGSCIFATQSITDILKNDGEFGNTILACSENHLLLKMKPADIRFVSDMLELTESETDTLRDFTGKGEALLCAGSKRLPVKILATNKEFEMFTTDPNVLAERLRQKS